MASTSTHTWRFFRAGGVDQVLLDQPSDLAHLAELPLELWMNLALPVRGQELDVRTGELLDSDHDGRIRPPEILEAVAWMGRALEDLGDIRKGGAVMAIGSIRDLEIRQTAQQLLAEAGKGASATLSLDDVAAEAKRQAALPFNGDGVVPASATPDSALQKAIGEIIAVGGSTPDRGGQPGVDQARVDGFFSQAEAYDAWYRRLEKEGALAPLGLDATLAAAAATESVHEKIDDWFARTQLASFDARSVVPLNGDEKIFEALARGSIRPDLAEVVALPLARVAPDRPLPLSAGINPAWAERMARFRSEAVAPLRGAQPQELSEPEWGALLGTLGPHLQWRREKPPGTIEQLGIARVRELLGSDLRSRLRDLIAQDKAQSEVVLRLESVERLVRYQRDLFRVINNTVSFADFYGRKDGLFQAGTLYLDARRCDLCVEVIDGTRHAALAQSSAAFLAYCDLTRPGAARRSIVAVFTDGDSDHLIVGRNGLFYDRQGRDWDATITRVVSNPISVREAFWLPYKRLVRFIDEQIAKRAQAADAESSQKASQAASSVVASTPAPAAATPAAPKKLDLGAIALVGTAVGGVSALVGGFLSALFGLGVWMPIGALGILLLISGPSMLLASLKLRQRNLGPLLDANGWAINTLARMNIPFGAALTHLARLPQGASRRLSDPFAERRRPWRLYVGLAAVVAAGLSWWSGRLDTYLPPPARSTVVLHQGEPKGH